MIPLLDRLAPDGRPDRRVRVVPRWIWVVAGVLVGSGLAPDAIAQGLDATVPSPCVLVFGHGRNLSDGQDDVNALWNELNQSFNQRVAEVLQSVHPRVISMVRPVQSRDLSVNVRQLLSRAAAEGCDRVVETTVFGEADTEHLVLRLRLHALVRPAGPPRIDAELRVGPPLSTVQRELPLIERSVARVMSGELARLLAGEIAPALSAAGPLPSSVPAPAAPVKGVSAGR